MQPNHTIFNANSVMLLSDASITIWRPSHVLKDTATEAYNKQLVLLSTRPTIG